MSCRVGEVVTGARSDRTRRAKHRSTPSDSPYRRTDIVPPYKQRLIINSTFLRQAGVDYTALRDRLKAGEWEEADNEHRRLMIELAGEDAEDRGWVYFTEVRTFPVTDLKTIDTLWSFYSDGKFGFSVQRKIWVGKRRQWAKMFKEIDWVQGENNAYRKWPEEFIWEKEAARGHMPLTNALRGTQLLEALLEHPAFAPPAKPKTAADQAADAVNQMGDNLKKVMGGGLPGLKGLKKPSWMK